MWQIFLSRLARFYFCMDIILMNEPIQNNNFSLVDPVTTPEEMLGPPHVDGMGILLVALTSVVAGGFISL